MNVLSVVCGLTAFVFVFLLLAPAGKRADRRLRRLEQVTAAQHMELYEDLERSLYQRFWKPTLDKLVRRLNLMMPIKNKSSHDQLQKLLRHAGIGLTVAEFTVVKGIFMAIILVLTLVVAFVLVVDPALRLLIVLMGLLAAVMVPTLFVRFRTQARTQSIRLQLPEVMDVLMVSVEAGLGLDEAILRCSTRMNGPIIEELMMLCRDMQMGRPRREAFAALGECADIQELKIFTSAMVQAEQLGIPIKNVLATQAAAMRTTRRQKAQERGMKAPVKMVLPMVLFILPVLFIVLLAPVVLQMMEQFG